jgi:hypothetical protein
MIAERVCAIYRNAYFICNKQGLVFEIPFGYKKLDERYALLYSNDKRKYAIRIRKSEVRELVDNLYLMAAHQTSDVSIVCAVADRICAIREVVLMRAAIRIPGADELVVRLYEMTARSTDDAPIMREIADRVRKIGIQTAKDLAADLYERAARRANDALTLCTLALNVRWTGATRAKEIIRDLYVRAARCPGSQSMIGVIAHSLAARGPEDRELAVFLIKEAKERTDNVDMTCNAALALYEIGDSEERELAASWVNAEKERADDRTKQSIEIQMSVYARAGWWFPE